MKTYQYTSPQNDVVAVIDADGVSRSSMLASALPEGVEVAPYVPPPPAVPFSVTPRQAEQALIFAGLLDAVEPAIYSIPDPLQRALVLSEWRRSQVFERERPAVVMLGAALGLTSAQIDELFIHAAQL